MGVERRFRKVALRPEAVSVDLDTLTVTVKLWILIAAGMCQKVNRIDCSSINTSLEPATLPRS